jgi:hypothetical protein
MDIKAVQQAQLRLARARKALADLEGYKGFSFDELEEIWWRFLLSASGVYSKLEQGAKGNSKSEAWFGRVKHERKTDPLLQYIHQARNSEEHSIEGSTSRSDITVKAISPNTTVINPPYGSDEPIRAFAPVGTKLTVELVPPGVRLVPVKNAKWGDVFHPPQTHLNNPIEEQSIVGVIRLAIAYLEKLIAQAEELSK